ncbi:hypothetical protein MIND_00290100 [Mycena indigotica]|uniref:MYND-type domain-containing protein n=1 Tax=Mycena indigotica TaxID=2126181 RepID=A0A8H6T897_9AGAR|nr:uncharacterized protein MIND_00290100 [Mycena indigotica]KAF7312750.1 hypothetical protein MIND_00290100 [Mycena indigotica]
MHPCFRVSQLTRGLHKSAAAAANKSLADLEHVATHCATFTTVSRFYLPIIYANLDPNDIPGRPYPTNHNHNAESPPEPILRALHAIRILPNVVAAPEAAKLELWPRLWPWLQLIERQSTAGRIQLAPTVAEAAIILLRPVAYLRPPCQPAILTFYGRIWYNLGREVREETRGATVLLHRLLSSSTPTPPDIVNALASDLPNKAHDLTALIVHDFSFQPTSDTFDITNSLFRVVILCMNSSHSETLFEAGVIKALTKLVRSLNTVNATTMIISALDLLIIVIGKEYMYPHLCEAVASGLLSALVAILKNRAVDGIPRATLLHLLRDLLPNALVYRSIARWSSTHSFPTVDLSEIRKDRDIRDAWISLEGLFAEAGESFRVYRSCDPQRQMCENPQCKSIKPLTELKRCAGCGISLFCDKACQRAAWKGRHRQICKAVVANPMTTGPGLSWCLRESKYHRHLVFTDYLLHKFDILLDQLRLIHRHGPRVRFVTVFDYLHRTAEAPVTISVLLLSAPELAGSRYHRLDWGDRLQTGYHRIVFDGGSASRVVLKEVPLMSSGTELTDGLLALSELIPEGVRLPNKSELETEFPNVYRGLAQLCELELDEVY